MIRVAADMLSIRKRNGLTHGLKLADKVEPDSSPDGPQRGRGQASTRPGRPPAPAFQAGDVIVRVGEQPVLTSLDFERALLDRSAGDKIALRRATGTGRRSRSTWCCRRPTAARPRPRT